MSGNLIYYFMVQYIFVATKANLKNIVALYGLHDCTFSYCEVEYRLLHLRIIGLP